MRGNIDLCNNVYVYTCYYKDKYFTPVNYIKLNYKHYTYIVYKCV